MKIKYDHIIKMMRDSFKQNVKNFGHHQENKKIRKTFWNVDSFLSEICAVLIACTSKSVI